MKSKIIFLAFVLVACNERNEQVDVKVMVEDTISINEVEHEEPDSLLVVKINDEEINKTKQVDEKKKISSEKSTKDNTISKPERNIFEDPFSGNGQFEGEFLEASGHGPFLEASGEGSFLKIIQEPNLDHIKVVNSGYITFNLSIDNEGDVRFINIKKSTIDDKDIERRVTIIVSNQLKYEKGDRNGITRVVYNVKLSN